jgi:hypothetical protein
MNIWDYTKTILPQWFYNGGYLEKLLKTNILPFDVTMQVLDYLPRMRDLNYVAKTDYKYHEYEKNIEAYPNEPAFELRIKKTFDTWKNAGSRPCIGGILEDVGFILDENDFAYGIQDGYQEWQGYENSLGEDGYSIWSGSDSGDPLENDSSAHKQVAWGHFKWGTTIDIWVGFFVDLGVAAILGLA